MEKFNVEYEKCEEHQNGTIVHLAIDKKYAGHIVISDEIKEDSLQAINDLKKCGVKDIVMLTGDNKATAENVAQELGITHVYSELLSQDKLSKVEELLADLNKSGKKGDSLIFTGDGINDSPALTQANVGIAIGNGTDIAIESADIVLMKNDLNDVVKATTFSRKTLKNIRQNLFWAFFYNIIGIPIAAGVLFPFFGITLSPMIGAAAMSLSSVFVVTNALRLYRMK